MSGSPRPSWGGGTDGGGALVQYTSYFPTTALGFTSAELTPVQPRQGHHACVLVDL